MNTASIILKKFYGFDSFKTGQYEVIENILLGNDTFCILPTGGGKSICYQIPALLFKGLTIVISPLVSLMKDQVENAKEIGIPAEYINSSLTLEETDKIIEKLKNESLKLLYIAPERLKSKYLVSKLKNLTISQIAIDEAHCVSMWGHDFRISYSNIAPFIESLPIRPVITAFTATATKEVINDTKNLLKLRKPFVFVGSFNRENLEINIVKGEEKLDFISSYIRDNEDKAGIIYCNTIKEVETLHRYLNDRGYYACKYHGKMETNDKNKNQEDFINENSNLIIATNAFGMGIDKSNVRYVIHLAISKSIEAYYQEIGRAGRDGINANCYLLYNEADIQTVEYLINTSVEINRRNYELVKLQKMIDFCEYKGCYREFILKYFSHNNVPDYCNRCSNCLNNNSLRDFTIESQKILSCVYRTKEKVGESVLVDILRGVRGPKVEQNEYFKLSTFAIMMEYSSTLIKDIIYELIKQDYVERKINTRSMLTLNEKSYKILKGNEQVFLKLEETGIDICLDQELFKKFRILRRDLSRRENVKPYNIFTDNVLIDIVNNLPNDLTKLKEIQGLGDEKIKKYGPFIRTIINDHIKTKNFEQKIKRK
ncbi:MAG: DNA helicase RecQ [Sarcina sp.]